MAMAAAAPELILVLGNKNLSSWSLRPWLLMRHACVAFREHVVLFETPGWRESIAALSPSHRVPALRHGELVVWDSLAIAEYVAELFPEARLWPEARGARALARSVSAEMHSGFANLRRELSMDVVARHPGRTTSKETSDEVARVLALWSECRRTASARDGGPFLFGRFSVADAMFAPVVWRFRTYGVAIEDALSRGYYEAMLALPAMKEWERDAELEVAAAAKAAAAAGAAGAAPFKAPDPTSAQAYFAVIFTSKRAANDKAPEAYEATAEAMVALAAKQPGFLGVESARGTDGVGITVSYWESLEAIRRWKDVPAHVAVQEKGRTSFYERYEVRVASVERGYKFP